MPNCEKCLLPIKCSPPTTNFKTCFKRVREAIEPEMPMHVLKALISDKSKVPAQKNVDVLFKQEVEAGENFASISQLLAEGIISPCAIEEVIPLVDTDNFTAAYLVVFKKGKKGKKGKQMIFNP